MTIPEQAVDVEIVRAEILRMILEDLDLELQHPEAVQYGTLLAGPQSPVGLDSIAFAELLINIEETFGISIEDDVIERASIFESVANLADYTLERIVLTREGLISPDILPAPVGSASV